MTAAILIQMGFAGSSSHGQGFDYQLPEATQSIVWRRSFPHAHRWPNIGSMTHQLKERGYQVRGLWIIRDWHAAITSQVNIGHAGTRQVALENIRRAHQLIPLGFAQAGVEWKALIYESVIRYGRETTIQLAEWLGVGTPCQPALYDGNEKHYALYQTEKPAQRG
jgi:hypothetical protein